MLNNAKKNVTLAGFSSLFPLKSGAREAVVRGGKRDAGTVPAEAGAHRADHDRPQGPGRQQHYPDQQGNQAEDKGRREGVARAGG